jgi:serine-type D-Ala-D-Ala carboxypeptidase/endopeptidase (penicillin-binding protein 4)
MNRPRSASARCRVAVVAAVPLLLAMVARPSPEAMAAGLDAHIQQIMDKPIYRHARFGLLEVDPTSGKTINELASDRFFVPGSTTKLFTVSAGWDTLGPDSTITTPLVSTGSVSGDTLDGDLVLIASGDLTMGGRLKPDGSIDYAPLDHTYADAVPGASLTPEDPLAGLDDLARQVRSRGISHLQGDVIIDDRLFKPDPDLLAQTPIIINDNVIDLLTTPTQPGQPAALGWRPQTAANHVDFQVKTVDKGQPTAVSVTPGAGGVITVTGTIAADAAPYLQVVPIAQPAAFARTALIEALGRAGVDVSAGALGPNPTPPDLAPGSAAAPLARLVSPPFREDAKLILKVSHNLGADLVVCLLAVHAGSRNCQDGFAAIKAFDRKAGVDLNQVSQADGAGGAPGDLFTPRAMVTLLTWWTRQPDFTMFRRSLPILGEEGDLAVFGTTSPARARSSPRRGRTWRRTWSTSSC